MYWLSFVKDGKFAGICIVNGSSIDSALIMSHILKINPGGEVQGHPIIEEHCQPGMFEQCIKNKNRLITDKDELKALFGPPIPREEL